MYDNMSQLRPALAIFLFLVTLVVLLFMYNDDLYRVLFTTYQSRSQRQHLNETLDNGATTENSTSRIKLILCYTPFYGLIPWPGMTNYSSIRWMNKPCLVKNCELTYDRNRLRDSDVVLFHAKSMPSLGRLQGMLRTKPSTQRWTYYNRESPKVSPRTVPLNGLFNWTATHRRDSDFWVPYGRYIEIESTDQISEHSKNFSLGKDRLVAWFVSNCRVPLRNSLVHQLQSYIQVDVFGGCAAQFGGGGTLCGPRKSNACKDALKRYKFYLALENGNCVDYMTEKYWSHLGDEDVLPIVMGGSDYSKEAIPGSYIDVMKFKTVEELASYLRYLDTNSTAYNEYFKWRKRYKVVLEQSFVCEMCAALNSGNKLKPKVYDHLDHFWTVEGKCNAKDAIVKDMLRNKQPKEKTVE